MIDYECHGRKTESTQHPEVLRGRGVEAGGSAASAGESLCDRLGEILAGQGRQQSDVLATES